MDCCSTYSGIVKFHKARPPAHPPPPLAFNPNKSTADVAVDIDTNDPPTQSLNHSLTHPSPPNECLMAESMRLPRGLLEKEHDASTAAAAKKVPANSTDGRVTPYSSIDA